MSSPQRAVLSPVERVLSPFAAAATPNHGMSSYMQQLVARDPATAASTAAALQGIGASFASSDSLMATNARLRRGRALASFFNQAAAATPDTTVNGRLAATAALMHRPNQSQAAIDAQYQATRRASSNNENIERGRHTVRA